MPLPAVARHLHPAFAHGLSFANGEEHERSEIPDEYKWDLTPLYPDVEAWRLAKENVAARIPGVQRFQGQLASSPAVLLEALDTMFGLGREFGRLGAYASFLADQDTRDSTNQAMRQEITQLGAVFSAEVAFLEPEILRMSRESISTFLAEQPGLRIYEHYLDDILRRQAHTGTESEERLIALAGRMAPGPSEIQGIFANADFPYPTVTLSDGKSVRLTQAAFGFHRAVPHRGDRETVMAAFFNALGEYRRTYGTLFNASVQKDIFYMKARRYDSTLETALDAANIPVAVYHSLIDGVNANLPTFHRYLELRRRTMGLDRLHYYDLYAPLVASVDLDFPIDQAQNEILACLAPLGPEYTSVIARSFTDRWIDLYPNPGKRTGAYSDGSAYDVHPYMLLNYHGKYTDMSTLAHELGHTMQSYFSNKMQPYPTADYPIFVAEVASTFNEALLIDHMLRRITDAPTRLSLLGNYLEGIKGTVFRQTQFAEFELRAHQMAEQGQPLTGDVLSALYGEIVRKYYGHDAGVCVVDDYVAHEWAFIPHFYRPFYVYQYATSFTASEALADRVLAGDTEARDRYLSFLGAGGSKYPIDLLKQAGVDMTTREPLDLTIRKMNAVMDEIERTCLRREPARGDRREPALDDRP